MAGPTTGTQITASSSSAPFQINATTSGAFQALPPVVGRTWYISNYFATRNDSGGSALTAQWKDDNGAALSGLMTLASIGAQIGGGDGKRGVIAGTKGLGVNLVLGSAGNVGGHGSAWLE